MTEQMDQVIVDFTTIAIQTGGWMEMDRLYLYNRLKTMSGYSGELSQPVHAINANEAPELAAQLTECYFQKSKQDQVSEVERKQKLVDFLDLLTPPTSVVNALFAKYYAKSPKEATDYFYQLNKTTGTIQKEGELIDEPLFVDKAQFKACIVPDSAMEKAFDANYRFDMEGSCGVTTEEIHTNRRMIRMNLQGESYGFHYLSDEILAEEFTVIAEKEQSLSLHAQLSHLGQLVELFPHYFVVTNKENDQERVGDQYRGARNSLPIYQASGNFQCKLPFFPDVAVTALNWPVPVLRLQATNQQALLKTAEYVIKALQQGEQIGDANNSLHLTTAAKDVLLLARKSDSGHELYVAFHSEKTLTEVQALGAFGILVMPNASIADQEVFIQQLNDTFHSF
ncbi:hypothetical protein [uncultured Enterococcus sp.]|uniref:hypothetical protein n=1 Tax=uncultured Enterococcus sp. TaxID=167972 RepID=UPI002599108B|nr:hypothetical protein [uncultured Enterococcus sp.]